MTNLPPGMYPPQQPIYGQQLLPGWENRTQGPGGGGNGGGGGGYGSGSGDGPFTEAFDFSFNTYASLRLVKIFYIVSIVILLVACAVTVIMMFLLSPIFGILALVLGVFCALLSILGLRIAMEVTLATVRTAIDTRALRNRYVGPVTE